MTTITNAIIPVLSLIVVGFLLRRTQFVPDHFWPSAEKLTYYVFFPALLIHNLANKKISDLPWCEMLFTVQGTVLVSALLLSSWRLFNPRGSGALFTSVFQGGVRFNTFIALAIAEALFGKEGLLIAVMGAAFMIPLINVLCVSAFSLTVPSDKVSLKGFFLSLAQNPLILGCLIGGALNVSGIGLHQSLDGPLALVGKPAFPLGLMAVGAAYRVDNLFKQWPALTVSSLMQLLCKPLIAFWLATHFCLSGTAAIIAVLLMAVPTAPSAYILSRQLGGDHDSMASIITVQTAISILTLPITLLLIS
ncbi:AEC family transporter [uncultured Desulfobacter sp.]|uniref:AEC family transporter n=1 Tax=uncultured Desulfobacter sp. TaxID=240139 RepID=UPI002AAAC688|nr:AEC family transporter [uncultured Desulfobacter sp.]